MNVLLTGSSGFLGSHLLPALLAAGHRVIITSRTEPVRASGVEWRRLDLARLAEDAEQFDWPEDIDVVINAAGLLSADPAQLDAIQDHGPRVLFSQAAERGIRILQVSALGAGEHADIAFLASKSRADDHVLQLGTRNVVLRPSLVVGPGGTSSNWLVRLSVLPVIPLLNARSQLQPVHVDDLVGAVLALLRKWPEQALVLPVVGPEAMNQGQLIDRLRAAQGWHPARYIAVPTCIAGSIARIGEPLGWRAVSRQTLQLVTRDNLADPEPLYAACGYRAAPLALRLCDWPVAQLSASLWLRPALLMALMIIWLGTAAVCLGPGYDWGLRIMAEIGVDGWLASSSVIVGALLDAALGLGLLLPRWRRRALGAQLGLMLTYTLFISLILPHYWFDPFMAVGKNLVLMPATLWLLCSEPPTKERRR
ncbi:hypothetical protein D3C78_638510 [compost metagenome]